MRHEVEGNNSDLIKLILRDKRLAEKWMDYTLASPAQREKFKFIKHPSGKLDIIDTSKEKLPEPQYG